MILTPNNIYHIYNQGNNRQLIFFNKKNYLFFIEKMRNHILPYADILAWCLMPNHFHIMIHVKAAGLDRTDKNEALNHSIGKMLSSYTQAINKSFGRSGSLFRKGTKAERITNMDELSPAFFDTSAGVMMNISSPETEYTYACFNYIHNNPVKAKLVANAKDWEFSSYNEYNSQREETLVNKDTAIEFGLI